MVETLPLWPQPIFINQGQQASFVKLDGLGKTVGLDQFLKGSHIQPVRRQGIPLQVIAFTQQPGRFRRHRR